MISYLLKRKEGNIKDMVLDLFVTSPAWQICTKRHANSYFDTTHADILSYIQLEKTCSRHIKIKNKQK